MTARGLGLLVSGVGLAVGGWLAGWPELSVLGAAAIVLVIAVLFTSSGGSRVGATLDAASLRVVRGEPASVRVSLQSSGRRRRLTRLVEGAPAQPVRTVPIPRSRRAQPVVLDVPVSTDRRGLHPLGPFTVVRGDPWSIVRTPVGGVEEGTLLVRPRTFPVRKGFGAAQRQGDSESMTRRSGDDHFFALRDYVMGDEPRNVHWRSSARSGRLVVRQKVAAAVDGTLVVLDTDETAYPSLDAFGSGFLEERFEHAVEVAASLCAARTADGQRVQLATTSRRQPMISQSAALQGLIDALAVVATVQPLDANPAELPSLARQSKCTHLIVVTGTPGTDLQAALRRCGFLSPVVVRVGGGPASSLPGVTTIDVPDAGALV